MTNASSSSPQSVQLIAFDFDGTITTKDTFALFLKYYAGFGKWLTNILILLPVFITYKLGLRDRHAVKAAVVNRFFKGKALSHIETKAEQFAKDVIPSLIRPAALERFHDRNQPPYTLYICSASISPYLRAWAHNNGLGTERVLAVELDSINGLCTGQIKGYNVWGANKPRRIADEMGATPYEIVESYGDSRGDKEMLSSAKASFWKPFRL